MAKKKEVTSIGADYTYDALKIRGKDGKIRTSRGNQDAVAKALLVFTTNGGEITTVINANKLQEKMAPHLKKKGPKAAGVIRMILGVMLRAMVRKGTPVKIGKELIEKLTQKVNIPKVEKLDRASAKKPKATKPAKKPKATKPAKKAAAKPKDKRASQPKIDDESMVVGGEIDEAA